MTAQIIPLRPHNVTMTPEQVRAHCIIYQHVLPHLQEVMEFDDKTATDALNTINAFINLAFVVGGYTNRLEEMRKKNAIQLSRV